MASIGSYLTLIDLGMSGSVARFLIDYKDDKLGGKYGSLIKTGWLVLVLQGFLVFLAGWFLAPLLSTLLDIPQDLRGQFIPLMRWLSTALALNFPLRLFSHLLQAHQRVDISNYAQIGTLAINFGLQWIFFHLGSGVFSLVWATLIGTVFGGLASCSATWKLRLFPDQGCWGEASWKHFLDLFLYGKDLFLIAVGAQLILGSQTLIITRRLGLEAAAAWYAGTRAFNLVCQAIWRISDSSYPALLEMVVRQEHARLRERYRAVFILTASVSGFAAVTFALCNSVFVSLLTHGKFEWPVINDCLLAGWIIVSAISHCHNGFVASTKEIGFMRYIYFLEGGTFVAVALLAAKWAGLPGIIACSIVCGSIFSGAYGIWRVSKYFELSLWEVAARWLAPMGRVLVFFVPTGIAAWWVLKGVTVLSIRLFSGALFCTVVGLFLLFRLGLSRTIQGELLQRAPKTINPILRRVFMSFSR